MSAPVSSDLLCCPIDGLPLKCEEKRYCCPNQHSFDRAKEGYVNLLPVQYKKTKDPGDNKAMVQARHQFLLAGFYQQIAQVVTEKVLRYWNSQSIDSGLAEPTTGSCLKLLDAGCGEGYYLRQMQQGLHAKALTCELIGLDISKFAIQKAAKVSKTLPIQWLVASSKQAPIQQGVLDFIVCLFGYCFYEEFDRHLNSEGRLIRVDAGPNHLIELRELIYPELKPSKDFDIDAAYQAGFELIETELIQYPLEGLSYDEVVQLLAMTPHLYRADKARLEALKEIVVERVSVDVVLRVFRSTSLQ